MKFILKGRVGQHSSPIKAFLVYTSGNKAVKDSTVLNHGNFEFTGSIIQPTRAELIIGNDDKKIMYLDKGIINVISKDSVKNANFPGSVINTEYQRYLAFMAQRLSRLTR